jgi:hypothetical protein
MYYIFGGSSVARSFNKITGFQEAIGLAIETIGFGKQGFYLSSIHFTFGRSKIGFGSFNIFGSGG